MSIRFTKLFGRRKILFRFVLVQDLAEQIVDWFENLFRGRRRQIQIVIHVVTTDASIVLHQTTIDLDNLNVGLTDATFGQQSIHLFDSIATAIRILSSRQECLEKRNKMHILWARSVGHRSKRVFSYQQHYVDVRQLVADRTNYFHNSLRDLVS